MKPPLVMDYFSEAPCPECYHPGDAHGFMASKTEGVWDWLPRECKTCGCKAATEGDAP